MITSTQQIPGTGGRANGAFGYNRPEIQDAQFKTPYDFADRWQLSRLCARLGIAHRDAERKAVLINMLINAEEAGKIEHQRALQMLDQIIHAMTRKPEHAPIREFVTLEAPDVAVPAPAPPVAPPSPESELWRFAKMTTKGLIEEAGKLGLKFKGTASRDEVFEALEKHLKG
ncbi:MAG TPA: hypothetical protein VF957_23505 [Bradyrhizobium sp.]